jgi:hypothetical protein
VLAQIYQASHGLAVDGVMAVDVVALADLVDAVGPVALPGLDNPLTGDNTAPVLLSEVYQKYEGDQEARRQVLGRAAARVADRLTQGGVPLSVVATRLGSQAHRRHLMAWSRDGGEEEAFTRAGLSGGLPADALPVLAAVENLSANKLDFYVTDTVDIALHFTSDRVDGVLTVTISNPSPGGLPQYVSGPNERSTLSPGDYEALVAIWLPRGMALGGLRGADEDVFRGTDGGYPLSMSAALLKPGQTRAVALSFSAGLAPGAGEARFVVPTQGRLVPVPVTIHAQVDSGWVGPPSVSTRNDSPVEGIWRRRGQ